MTVWMEVTRDRYQLPVAVAESLQELAAMVGVKPESITQHISRVKHGRVKRERFCKVEVDKE